MDFKDYLKDSAHEINLTLQSILEKWSKDVDQINQNLSPLIENFIEASEGGKRLRGTLVKLGFEMAEGGEAEQDSSMDEILKIASTFEIFQTAILAHDDIIDKSETRRNKPTIYKKLGGDHYATSQTIVLGDVAFFLAYKIISSASLSDELTNKAVQAFSETLMETCFGEMLDVELPHLEGEKIEEDTLTIFRLKTARYTLVGPLQLGAILANASDRILSDIILLGEKLGVAFQIQDDILGVFGEEETLGKSVTSDIEEGKNTLLIIEGLKKATPDQKQTLESIYGKGKISAEELEEVRKIFTETGALKYSEEMIEKLVTDAKKVIKVMQIDDKYKGLLAQMADFIIQRQK